MGTILSKFMLLIKQSTTKTNVLKIVMVYMLCNLPLFTLFIYYAKTAEDCYLKAEESNIKAIADLSKELSETKAIADTLHKQIFNMGFHLGLKDSQTVYDYANYNPVKAAKDSGLFVPNSIIKP